MALTTLKRLFSSLMLICKMKYVDVIISKMKLIPNEIAENAPIINFNVQNFNLFLMFDNYLFIGSKQICVHKIMTSTKITDNLFKQNPEFGTLIHDAFDQFIQCAKFNVIYNHIHKYHDMQCTFTEYGYQIYKYEKDELKFNIIIPMMKSLIEHILTFTKIIKINYHPKNSQPTSKSTNKYFLISNTTSKIHNVNKTILYKTIINIPISLFQFYSLRYNNPINFNVSILKKQTSFLKQNLTSILQNHLNINLDSFTSDFRTNLEILIPSKNNELTCLINTPQSIVKKKKPSFYPRDNGEGSKNKY
ncbi:hypothetical protein FWK35_00016221 [Aphis craccivora]|uniref:Uncharacterized protein n=1 Tax=Aphis craccivora TaxID=307492 RepID=A0A6G0Y8S5_APHCR|nr:hypothetical protein FWK35_00016221 [Aphis craccivora]